MNNHVMLGSSPVVQQGKDPLSLQQVKDLLSLQQLGFLLWQGFGTWPANFHKPKVQSKKKKKNLFNTHNCVMLIM